MSLKERVAKNLRECRLKVGLTQKGLAEKSKFTTNHLSQMENQGLNLTLDTIERLARGLGLPASELLEEESKVRPTASKKDLPGIDTALRLLRAYKNQIQD